jgi:predicted GIY-YIG superfamily endonuclease
MADISSSTVKYYCYILFTGDRTYCGYTSSLNSRLQQHNGLRPGGAKATRVAKGWRYLLVLHSASWSRSRAMQVEAMLKSPKAKKSIPKNLSRVETRLQSLTILCGKVTESIVVYVEDCFIPLVKNITLAENFDVKSFDGLETKI